MFLQTISDIHSVHRHVLMHRVTYREEFEERVLENLPLFVLIGDQRDVHFAEILREQEDETDGSETQRIQSFVCLFFRLTSSRDVEALKKESS